LHFLQSLEIRNVRESAHRHGHGVDVAAGDRRAQVVGELLEPERPLHHRQVGGRQRQHAAHAEKVGGGQVVSMEDVGLQGFAVKADLP